MTIHWTENASRQLDALHAFIAEDSLAAADRIFLQIVESVDSLEMYPLAGREGRVRNTRELVIGGTPYIVAYRAGEDVIDILAILHGKQRWPSSF